MLDSISPFFIVDDLSASLEYYESRLGFEVLFRSGGDGQGGYFFAIVGRDTVTLMLKQIGAGVQPQSNRTRHRWARWDAFVSTSNPDALYQELLRRHATIHKGLADTGDGLRAFEILDNGYVLCFGRPHDQS